MFARARNFLARNKILLLC